MKKKILLSALVIILVLVLVSCDGTIPPTEILSADIVILGWEQDYYEPWQEWSYLVKFCYKITNTGNVDIDYYQAWFTAYSEDGSNYEDWTNGSVDVGCYECRTSWINLGENKRIISVEVTDWKLTHYNW